MSSNPSADEDILLKLSMPGKPLRMKSEDAPQLPEQPPSSAPQPSPSSQQQPVSVQHSFVQQPLVQPQPPTEVSQPPRVVSSIVPPANTPPPTAEAQDDILRKLSMKPKDYSDPAPAKHQEAFTVPAGMIYQTPEEIKSNKPYVSSQAALEKVKNIAQCIISSDLVARKVKK